jgi:MEDS: MEthanogen/methylotroph, DcmR Sensory domain
LEEYAMKGTAAPIPFAGSMLGAYRHVCAFFSSPHEEYDSLLPFVKDGLERGERAYQVLPSRYRDEYLEQLRSAGIDVAGAQRRRQLEMTTVQEAFLRDGRFNKDAMLVLIEDVLKSGATLGFHSPV